MQVELLDPETGERVVGIPAIEIIDNRNWKTEDVEQVWKTADINDANAKLKAGWKITRVQVEWKEGKGHQTMYYLYKFKSGCSGELFNSLLGK